MNNSQSNAVDSTKVLQDYYRWHARIYDATRWSFIFGRRAIIGCLAAHHTPQNILEIGCGTGKNLVALARRFPNANIVGLDTSVDMLNKAEPKMRRFSQRISLENQAYPFSCPERKFDLILFSYALSMFNPGWQAAISAAYRDSTDDGVVAVVDFHTSNISLFRKWMEVNHVRMEGHLLPILETVFSNVDIELKAAYGGVWYYFLFTGRRSNR